MPYRHAHWYILALLPIIGLAFWPHYYGDLPHATFAFHAHGITATCWILLVGAQSWTIHHRRPALHRLLGLAVYALVPLFAGGAALAMQSMATKFLTRSDPFYAALGARLGMQDLVATTALVLMARQAMVRRRTLPLHAGYLLASVILVIPPIVSRLPVPHLWHLGEFLTLAVALPWWVRNPRRGWPFLLVSLVTAGQAVIHETISATDAWARLFVKLVPIPSALLAAVAMAAAAALLWPTWPRRRVPARPIPHPA